jgi:hypothetical protein
MATLPANLRLSKREIKNASYCAEALWYGINYKNSNPIFSDELLLKYFAEPMYKNGKYAARFDPDIFKSHVQILKNVCGLKALNFSVNRMDYNQGIVTIKTKILQHFVDVKKKHHRLIPVNLPDRAILDLSDGLVTQPRYRQIVLASRILYFNTPNLETFNISSGLAKNLGFDQVPDKYLTAFNVKMRKIYLANATQLSACKKPKALYLKGELANSIDATSWWQRRVLDLALMLRFGLVNMDPTIPQRVLAARIDRDNLLALKMERIKAR